MMISIKVEPYCTMSELTKIVCDKFGLSAWHQDFTLRIIANLERFTSDTNSNAFKGTSQVIHWYGRWKDIVKKHPLLRYKIVLFKWRFNPKYDIKLDDKDMIKPNYIHFVYSQCKYMVNNGQIPIGLNDCLLLASLSLIISNKGKLMLRHELNKDVVIKLIPYRLRQKVEIDELIHQIFDTMRMLGAIQNPEQYERFLADKDGKNLLLKLSEWETKYIQYLAKNVEMYGVSFFNVNIIEWDNDNDEFEEDQVSLLGVHWDHIFICKDERSVIKRYGLHQIQDLQVLEEVKEVTFKITDDKFVNEDEMKDIDDQCFSMRLKSEFVQVIGDLIGEFIADKDQSL